METGTVLDVRNLSVKLDGDPILTDVSFAVSCGEIVAVVGPNGSGKTTLFRALLGLVPAEGKICWRPGTSTAYVPQRFTVPSSMPISVTEFFLLKGKRFWLPDEALLRHLTHELSLLGLSQSVLGRPLGTLSGGQIQRLLVAWALLGHPDVVLFDEPTASVDVGFAETVYDILRRLTRERGSTILLISHDLNVVAAVADKVLCLNRTITCEGPPEKVLTPDGLRRLFGEGAVHHPPYHGHGA